MPNINGTELSAHELNYISKQLMEGCSPKQIGFKAGNWYRWIGPKTDFMRKKLLSLGWVESMLRALDAGPVRCTQSLGKYMAVFDYPGLDVSYSWSARIDNWAQVPDPRDMSSMIISRSLKGRLTQDALSYEEFEKSIKSVAVQIQGSVSGRTDAGGCTDDRKSCDDGIMVNSDEAFNWLCSKQSMRKRILGI